MNMKDKFSWKKRKAVAKGETNKRYYDTLNKSYLIIYGGSRNESLTNYSPRYFYDFFSSIVF